MLWREETSALFVHLWCSSHDVTPAARRTPRRTPALAKRPPPPRPRAELSRGGGLVVDVAGKRL